MSVCSAAIWTACETAPAGVAPPLVDVVGEPFDGVASVEVVALADGLVGVGVLVPVDALPQAAARATTRAPIRHSGKSRRGALRVIKDGPPWLDVRAARAGRCARAAGLPAAAFIHPNAAEAGKVPLSRVDASPELHEP